MANKTKSSDEWQTIAELAAELGVSDRTVRRRIESGEYEAKKEGRKILVKVDKPDTEGVTMADMVSKDEFVDVLRGQVADLKAQLQQKDGQIEALHEELSQAREQSNTIILQLTRQVEQSQRLLEYHREPFWRRWFRRERGGERRTEDFS